MNKVNSDYTCLHSKKETIKIISKFKNKLRVYLENEFNLLEIDPKYIINLNQIYSKERIISFNNSKENTIYQISPYINNQLIDVINNYDFAVNTGIISYAATFCRDYEFDLLNAPYEFIMYVYIKDYIAEINESRIEELAIDITHKINTVIDQLNCNLLKIPEKIYFTSIDKLYKEFFSLSAPDVISHASTKYDSMFAIGVNGNNHKNISYIEDKFSAYGEITGCLYVFSPINTKAIRILTISISPNRSELINKINKHNLNEADFEYALSTLGEDSSAIGIEIHFDQLMMYVMQKYSIHEVVSTPLELNVSKKFIKSNLL